MVRPLRIEYPHALYHVTARGNRQQSIFEDDADRRRLLAVVGETLVSHGAWMWSYCLMGNHYHFVLQTERPNLSDLMHRLNGKYAQAFNRRHGRVGHLFQGRYHAVVVDQDAYLLEVCRYVELNPVRAGLVPDVSAWAWSSYRAHVGLAPAHRWLATARVRGLMMGRDVTDATTRRDAAARYAAHVAAGVGAELWRTGLRQEIYLGDERFIEQVRQQVPGDRLESCGVSRVQRASPLTIAHWLAVSPSRDDALFEAHAAGMSMTEMAAELGISQPRVSQLIARVRHRRAAADDGAAC